MNKIDMQKHLDRVVDECINDIEGLGIELGNIVNVTINTRAKKRWGQCRHTRNGCYITISDRLLEDGVDEWALKNTVAHELLHTIRGGGKHTGEWKWAAEKMSRAYGYTIKRCTSCEEKGVTESPKQAPKYIIKCGKCGHEYKYYRKSKMINNFIDRPAYVRKYCKCSICQSHDLVLQGWQILTVHPHYNYI